MKTFILMWNPAISSFKMEDFRDFIKNLNEYWFGDKEEYMGLNWSIWDHEQAEYGDRFFMVRVGEGKTGIVMSGTLRSDPYEAEDWSGKGRKTFYMDLLCDIVVDSEKAPHITTEQLMEKIPGFDWTGGHSGRLLDTELAEQLEVLWLEYHYKNPDMFEKEGAISVSPGVPYINEILEGYLSRRMGRACEICGYDYRKPWGEDCQALNLYRLFWTDKQQRKSPEDSVWKHIHCICRNCNSVSEEQLCNRVGETFVDIFSDEP